MGSKGIVATNIAAATAMLTTITMIAVNSVRGPFILEPSLLKGGLVRQVGAQLPVHAQNVYFGDWRIRQVATGDLSRFELMNFHGVSLSGEPSRPACG